VKIRLTVASALALALAVAGCGSRTTSGSSGAGSSGAASHGTVSVLYAGSLVNLMEHDLGPAFTRADGYGFSGFGAGSTELVAQIKGQVRQGDVFVSASPKADKGLEGASNGSWISWYITFAKAPLVLGYNPSSQFAAQFRSKPWYEVVTQPGIRVGITDPKLDPKGKLTVEAMNAAAAALHKPTLASLLSKFAVFPEESLVGRLEAGQLDAGFFYANEAKEQHIPTVTLAPVKKDATYTVAILKQAADPQGAEAFVSFLLGASGREMLSAHGLKVLPPKLTGDAAAVPEKLRTLTGG
jgi:molybdate/tungstate transport system substrate-binding protein